jgi:hypothetical protein
VEPKSHEVLAAYNAFIVFIMDNSGNMLEVLDRTLQKVLETILPFHEIIEAQIRRCIYEAD